MELYQKGMNDVEIGEKLFCCREIVFDWRKANHLPPIKQRRARKVTEAHLEQIRKMREEGKSDRAIGELIGLSKETVWTWRKKKGIS